MFSHSPCYQIDAYNKTSFFIHFPPNHMLSVCLFVCFLSQLYDDLDFLFLLYGGGIYESCYSPNIRRIFMKCQTIIKLEQFNIQIQEFKFYLFIFVLIPLQQFKSYFYSQMSMFTILVDSPLTAFIFYSHTYY